MIDAMKVAPSCVCQSPRNFGNKTSGLGWIYNNYSNRGHLSLLACYQYLCIFRGLFTQPAVKANVFLKGEHIVQQIKLTPEEKQEERMTTQTCLTCIAYALLYPDIWVNLSHTESLASTQVKYNASDWVFRVLNLGFLFIPSYFFKLTGKKILFWNLKCK